MFWDEEKLSYSNSVTGPLYRRCCLEGRVVLFTVRDWPPLIQRPLSDSHFLGNIRAYNQTFAMTSLGATIGELTFLMKTGACEVRFSNRACSGRVTQNRATNLATNRATILTRTR